MSISTDDLLKRYRQDYGEKELLAFLTRRAPLGREDFIQQLYGDLLDIFRDLEAVAPSLLEYPKPEAGGDVASLKKVPPREEKMRDRVVSGLRRLGYDASAEAHHRGHTDLMIRCKELRLMWIAEAKIHRDYGWLESGLRQLMERYTTGRDKDMALIVFCFVKDAAGVMRSWQARMDQEELCGLLERGPDALDGLGFESKHVHGVSGTEVVARHFFVALG